MNGTQTLARALDILFVLAEADMTLSVSDISEKVSIPESTTYRLLQTLEQNGIIERKSKGQIGLGMRILELARSLQHQIDRELHTIARPIMEKLTEKTSETSILAVRAGLNVTCIQMVESRRMIRFVIETGRTLPLHLGATGKAILAFESRKVIEQVVQSLSEEEKQHLLEELRQVREMGYCNTVGEVDPDIFGAAAPIFDEYDRVVASVTVAGPAARLAGDRKRAVIQEVVQAADDISAQLQQIAPIKNLQTER
ncbi:IclR family transcriptional regulator [Effusibacillus pohliae]|uniref:IclR family transcriptional regulator n=1 Tax=Effusibacillus pohliae TaxID=232270 RepID=UPI0003664625|nr:IclR family transcriptional regulator [Effusibacillus pohliae]